MEILPSLDRVYQMLVQEEHQRNLNSTPVITEATTLYTQKKYVPPKNRDKQIGKDEKVCTSCKRGGHLVDSCYYIHGFPKGHPLHGKKFERRDWRDKDRQEKKNYHTTTERTTEEHTAKSESEGKVTLTTHQWENLMSKINGMVVDPH